MMSLTAAEKTVAIWPGRKPGAPVIYLNTYGEEGQQVRQEMDRLGCPDCSLVAISGLDWNRDLSPWAAPAIRREEEPFAGGAADYLKQLTGEILPAVQRLLPGETAWRGLAGYSMAGLFAVWAMGQTDAFRRGASVSGSLWFPGIREYLLTHRPRAVPDCLYFSLGSKESKTRNPALCTVEENTRAIEAFYRGQGIETIFQLNPGNHFRDGAARTAAGIAWMLER